LNIAKKVLVLGGYGNFGKLICDFLKQRPDIELIIAGRNRKKADRHCELLKTGSAKCQVSSLALDVHSSYFPHNLKAIHPHIVIHTSGPFQGQDYHVPTACIAAGSHYIDLADDRRFVCDFHTLNDQAIQHHVIAISGASSVPGLSSVVIDHYAQEFTELDKIDYAIVPGSNVDIGEATLKGILSYAGHPFTSWEQGKFTHRYGWMDSRRLYLGATLGTRWLANADIPDLELFPARYPGIKTVRFQAGHELGIVHLSMAFMAMLAKLGWITRWDRYSSILFRAGQYIKQLGSDCGGMVIQLSGINKQGQRQKTVWRLIAKAGSGPRIPTISAIILADRILDGGLTGPGARPCLGVYNLDEFFKIAGTWGIYQEVERAVE
jgi:saccharopine dehydrogenase-like NADP-dependent oxidoreductase